MKEADKFVGHSNRVFCVRFNPTNQFSLVSGGWDNTLQIYDIRRKGPVANIYGPHICGDAIDYRHDGYTLLTGSYREEDAIELWDLRTLKKFRDIPWDGPKASEGLEQQLEEDQDRGGQAEEDKENQEPAQIEEIDEFEPVPAAFIYTA